MRLVWSQHALADRDNIFRTLKPRTRGPRSMSTIKSSQLCGGFSSFRRAADPAESPGRASLSFPVRPSSPPMP